MPEEQPSEGFVQEFLTGLQDALGDASKEIARDAAQTVWLMYSEYQRAGFTPDQAFTLILTTLNNND